MNGSAIIAGAGLGGFLLGIVLVNVIRHPLAAQYGTIIAGAGGVLLLIAALQQVF
jgi:hypothetical protein